MPESKDLAITVAEEKVKLDSHLDACTKATQRLLQAMDNLEVRVKRLEIIFYIALGSVLGYEVVVRLVAI